MGGAPEMLKYIQTRFGVGLLVLLRKVHEFVPTFNAAVDDLQRDALLVGFLLSLYP